MEWYFIALIIIAALLYMAVGIGCFKEVFSFLIDKGTPEPSPYDSEMTEPGIVLFLAIVAFIVAIFWPLAFTFMQWGEEIREVEKNLTD